MVNDRIRIIKYMYEGLTSVIDHSCGLTQGASPPCSDSIDVVTYACVLIHLLQYLYIIICVL